jgi:hypothetical protein
MPVLPSGGLCHHGKLLPDRGEEGVGLGRLRDGGVEGRGEDEQITR